MTNSLHDVHAAAQIVIIRALHLRVIRVDMLVRPCLLEVDGIGKLASATAAADAGEASAAGGGAPRFGAAASTDGACDYAQNLLRSNN